MQTAAYWVESDGTLRRGEAAIAAALREAGGGWRVAGKAIDTRLVRPVARRAYYWVAANRHRLSRDGACAVE